MILSNLQPERVFYWFERLLAIPHGSGNTKQISDFCVQFAKDQGLECRQDELNNVVIYKNASPGKEQSAPVILQGHLDMVCEKAADREIDFTKEGITPMTQGDLVSADGTTLGGDDGIAVAMAMAILEDDRAVHPPLEVLFTVDEETGMYGAAGLNSDWLKGKTLINVDSEEEGVLTVGCAGGTGVELRIDLIPTAVSAPCKEIVIKGLKGGHSGVEIHKGRHNANKLMAKLLGMAGEVQLISLTGGRKDNVIPSVCTAKVSTDAPLAQLAAKLTAEYRDGENAELEITVRDCKETLCYDTFSSMAAIAMMDEMPNGVQKWSEDIEGLVQTSLNMGIVNLTEDQLRVRTSLRSSLTSDMQQLCQQLYRIGDKHGALVLNGDSYPAWEFRKDSPLRETMIEVYRAMYDKEPEVALIHAGLECGLLSEKIPGMDAVSIGPNMWDIHTPNERLSIASVQRTYDFIAEILKRL